MMQTAKREKTEQRCLVAALVFNAVFLALALLLYQIGFESNDDLTLAAFVDGQMAVPTAHIPYINIVLGVLLKGIYTVLGRGVAWHTLCQMLLLCLSFTAMSFVLCRRLGIPAGICASAALLLFIGTDVYTIISYTKTAAVCTVGGMLLLTDAMERENGLAARIAGVALCVFGFMLRPMEFLPCFGIAAALCFRWLWGLLFEETGGAGEKAKRLLRAAAPFLLTVALCGALYAVNEAAWRSPAWEPYHTYDAIRVAYSDYGRPEYREMPETYEALGLSETDARLLCEGNYFDPDAYSGETMQAISEARDAAFPRRSWGECLGVFLDKCLGGFFVNLPVYGLLLTLALWLCGGQHRLKDWLTLALAAALFTAAYLYLILRGRYLIDRVDAGLLLALAAVAAAMLDPERLKREKTLAALLLALSLLGDAWLMRDSLRMCAGEDFGAERTAVEMLLQDTEHVYLAKLDTVSDRIYSPFEPAGKGYWDRIVLLGGFDCNHPAIMNNLALYGVKNPYRDAVGNDRVYFIEDDIDLTLAHIRERYDPGATAERVEPLSEETGLEIYRILAGEEAAP